MTLVALVRHGPTEWNEARRLQGRRDIPLSENGIKTVAGWTLPEEFRGFDWVASPLSRARQTAEALGITYRVEPAVQEMDWGAWDGHTVQELREKFGDVIAQREAEGIDLRPDEGESPRDVRTRIAAWLDVVQANGQPTGAVCHQGIIRAMLSLATGWDMVNKPPEKMEWAAVQLFRLTGDGSVAVERLNISLEA